MAIKMIAFLKAMRDYETGVISREAFVDIAARYGVRGAALDTALGAIDLKRLEA